MLEKYNNKQDKSPVIKSVTTQEYFFSGGGVYEPLTIIADSHDKALELYEKNKKLIKQ